MAIIQCVDCGKDISDRSEICINCGAPTRISLLSELTSALGHNNRSEGPNSNEGENGNEKPVDFNGETDNSGPDPIELEEEVSGKFRCSFCGSSHTEKFVFCGECGREFKNDEAKHESNFRNCWHCNSSNSNGSKYCYNCGHSLAETATEEGPVHEPDRRVWQDWRSDLRHEKDQFTSWWRNFSFFTWLLNFLKDSMKSAILIIFVVIPLTFASILGMTWMTGNWHVFRSDWPNGQRNNREAGVGSGLFDVVGVHGTGSRSRDQYDVTLRNSSSRRITVFTYLQTSDGYQFCPTEHTLRPNRTTIDTVRCNMFRSINNERYEIYVTDVLPNQLARQIRSGRNIGRVEGFR